MPATPPEFVRQLRRALASLYDPVTLRSHPLAWRLGAEGGTTIPSAQIGAALRQQLLDAIDMLQPAAHLDSQARAWRAHRILQLRYVDAHDAVRVQRELAMSKSQYYREHEYALESLAERLLELGWARVATEPPVVRTPGGGAAEGPGRRFPVPLTRFIGRETELSELQRMLHASRLLTLVGFGGAGKTRLALQAATEARDQYRDGVWLVELASLAEAGLVPQTVAVALGVPEAVGEPLAETLVRAVGFRELLVVLDNCEHVVAAVSHLVEALLRTCPHLHVLVTSREVLGLAGELVWDVPPLAAPGPHEPASVETLVKYEAVQLFLDRAASVRPGFGLTDQNAPVVAQICQRLEGIPLALELAAARIRVLSVDQLARGLDDRFHVLTAVRRGGLRQHQTLRALVDWSYDLLTAPVQRLLQRLTVFAGGWTLEAAEAVCSDALIDAREVLDLLSALTDKSLVQVELAPTGDVRYRMLETLREYAAARLMEGSAERPVRDRHSDYFARLVRGRETGLEGPEQIVSLQGLERERDNLRAVMTHGATSDINAEHAAATAAILGYFWFLRNSFTEAHTRLEEVWRPARTPTAWTIRCQAWDAFFAASLGQPEAARLSEAAVAEARAMDDGWPLAWALLLRCGVLFVQGQAVAMEATAREAVAVCVRVGWRLGAAITAAYLGRALLLQRETAEAITWLGTARAHARQAGDPFSNALVLSFQGAAVSAQGDYPHASAYLSQALELFRALGSLAHESRCLVDWAAAALEAGQINDAAQALRQGIPLARRLGAVPYRFAQLVAGTAQVAAAHHEREEATRRLAAATALRAHSGSQLPPERQPVEAGLRSALQANLGGDAFDRAWGDGLALSPEQALSLAEQSLAAET